MNTRIKNEKGFTIIEVVLVLAIAALIFLMIFIALPALQRGQRDTARKNDANTIVAALGQYRSAHRGQMPTTIAQFQDYLGNLNQYDLAGVKLGGSQAMPGDLKEIHVRTGAKCNDAGDNYDDSGSSRQAAVMFRIEANGASASGVQQCVEG